MSKLILIAAGATATLSLGACSYNDQYNNQGYNAAGTDYNAAGENYAGNAAGYAADNNAANYANTADNMTNATGNTGAANTVTNNGY